MIRFIASIIIVSAIYCFIYYIGQYDSNISILISNYKVSASLFLLIAFMLFLLGILILLFRLVSFVIRMPFIVGSRLASYRKNTEVRKLLDAYFAILSNDPLSAGRILGKIGKESFVLKEYEDHVSLIKVLSGDSNSIKSLDSFKDNKAFYLYVLKNLVKDLFESGSAKDALRLIENSKYDDKNDASFIILKARIYATQNIWHEYEKNIDRYSKLDKNPPLATREKISQLYLAGAKYFSKQDDEKTELEYLQNALLTNPESMEALELFYSLSNSLGKQSACLRVLESAFKSKPSFEIFELYKQSSDLDGMKIYDKFAYLADVQKFRHIFLSIAALLKLQDKIDLILSQKK